MTKKRIKKDLSVDIGEIKFTIDQDELIDSLECLIVDAIEIQMRDNLTQKINAVVKKVVKEYATDEKIEELATKAIKKELRDKFTSGFSTRSYL